MSTIVKFSKEKTTFSRTLKSNINDYFIQNNFKKTGNRKLTLKAIILLSSLIILYITLVFVKPHWSICILLCAILGVNLAAIGFNIMHDAGHNTFSDNKRVNSVLSYSLNLLGGNIYLWKLKHNIAHHTYTNIDGEDHDIEIKFMRIHHDQPLKKHHRFQHLYFIFLYAISYLGWIFYQDYEKFLRSRLSQHSDKIFIPFREKIIFWISKLIHIVFFIIVPIISVGLVPTVIGLLVVSVVCGLCLATVFQLAHVVSSTEFKSIEDYKVEDEWMVHQLKSTSNFATRNKFLTWLLGGLNFQVEHHLFPKISHIHYPELNRIVKSTCNDFGIPYHEYPTFWSSFNSHFNFIKTMRK
ncbi:fatty acid desaturase family protein [Sphingobacterium sp. 1.A.4]|uniref:fatty acid desaturase family protein n=1 Tax=Sphingobacterium sp. 1.A.4 TaxID=2044603 RepID=UPI000C0BC3C6|nr:acyl-CoA desaturase [Sphingobacterium sp. 1.A.4]